MKTEIKVIERGIADDAMLSLRAKGLLACIKANGDEDSISKDRIKKMTPDSHIEPVFNELILSGYLSPNRNGYKISRSVTTSEQQYGVKYNINSDYPWDGKQPINYESFLNWWNKCNGDRGGKLRMTDKKRKQIRGRLRNFTGEEIKTAIRCRAEDPWINGEGIKYKNKWDALFCNDEKMEHWLNKFEQQPRADYGRSESTKAHQTDSEGQRAAEGAEADEAAGYGDDDLIGN